MASLFVLSAKSHSYIHTFIHSYTVGSNPTRFPVMEMNVPLNLKRIMCVARRKFYNSALKINLSFNFKQTYDKMEECKLKLKFSLGTLPNYTDN